MNSGRINIGYVNMEILNRAIFEEDDQLLVEELIKLQGQIEMYARLGTEAINQSLSAEKEISPALSTYVTNSARVTVQQAKKCKTRLFELRGIGTKRNTVGLPSKKQVVEAVQKREDNNQIAALRWLFDDLSTPQSTFEELDLYELLCDMEYKGELKSYVNTLINDKSYTLDHAGKRLLEEARRSDIIPR